MNTSNKLKFITALLGISCICLLTAATSLAFRDYRLHHLKVTPGTSSSLASTNVAEFTDATGTNAIVITTNRVAGIGPRIQVRQGATTHDAVTNMTVTVTNNGTVQTFVIRNGIATVD